MVAQSIKTNLPIKIIDNPPAINFSGPGTTLSTFLRALPPRPRDPLSRTFLCVAGLIRWRLEGFLAEAFVDHLQFLARSTGNGACLVTYGENFNYGLKVGLLVSNWMDWLDYWC